jgi:hypothetical protein
MNPGSIFNPVQNTSLHRTHNRTHFDSRSGESQATYRDLRWNQRGLGLNFLLRWTDYVAATKLDGKDKVIQLLECCEELLRKDLTRTTGGKLRIHGVISHNFASK